MMKIVQWLSFLAIGLITPIFANPANYSAESRHISDASSSVSGRSAIAIVEEDKRCFACKDFQSTGVGSQCIVPCHYNQRCYLKAANATATLTDRRCTDERWVRDLLVDGCLTYNGLYWCMCSTDLCNAGDFTSIRGFDDCSTNPCPSGTICLDTKDGFSCICPPWQDHCTYSYSVGCTCKNGGRCMMGLGSYICECPYGYTGVNCEIKTRAAFVIERLRRDTPESATSAPSSCGGRCERRTCNYRPSGQGLAPSSCTCNTPSRPATASSCEKSRAPPPPPPKPYVACNPNPCQSGQTCQSLTPKSFYCGCQSPYIGSLCERSNPCSQNSSCSRDTRCVVNGQRQASCVCNTPSCQRRDACTPNPCQNGGSCVFDEPTGSFRCYCPDGYSGRTCDIRSDPCALNPCQNNGACMANGNSFYCSCGAGFSGERCEIHDPCFQNPCLNGGHCSSNGAGSYTCTCIPPYTGHRCEERNDPCGQRPCQNGGTCRPTPDNSYQCTCPQGCSGRDCSIRKVCEPNPCVNGGTCSPYGLDTYSCNCPFGFTGRNCETRDPCIPSPCQNSGRCRSNIAAGTYVCECPGNFLGQNCETIDPCARNPCLNDGQCIPNGAGGYTCNCRDYFTGQHCENRPNPCASHPCQNGGTCQAINSQDWRCICPSGFSGNDCSRRDVCLPNPCLNGGACVPNGIGGFTCQCPATYTGPRCEDQDVCAQQPCKNRGDCVSTGGGTYQCHCRSGFEGQNCEQVDICGVRNPCACGTCQNDASNPLGFRCFCPPGYSGDRCDRLINCMDNGEECTNGGQCIQRALGDYVCSCPYPYCGPRCESQRPNCPLVSNTRAPNTATSGSGTSCSSNLCNNHGTCQETGYGRSIQCYCSPGWSGSRCQYRVGSSCKDSQGCANGGTCREVADNVSICHCPSNFSGDRCEHANEYRVRSGYERYQYQQHDARSQHDNARPSATNVEHDGSAKTKKRQQIYKN